ncbi:dGTPase [Arcobacter sp. CECT 8986]|uniref:dGTPase n=1 Tax=Arcobacter sp. CECT 8986 TaxID=2044507 RepID=UPI001009D33D|nr:dGTPase [Arcobacter sp. CECT 8986]RXK01173.1 dGTPase [Arcobacter sp. CECT 8986]
MIDYRKKITCTRKYQRSVSSDIDLATESNRGRIVNSPAVRRLQQKTQVFPLEINAAVRSRLTHSLEVQQTARYISKSILKELRKNNKLKKYNLQGLEEAFISTSEMASLMHDIGNPPFGHFGELAINVWMKSKGIKCFNKALNIKQNSLLEPEVKVLKKKLEKDICNFEGNAQGVRIVHNLQSLNLTYSQIASILKYTRVAYENKPNNSSPFSYLKKKPGFYYSEEEFVQEVCTELKMKNGHRFPLTYIMEAADDISYGIADLEDAVDKGILSLKKLYEIIVQEASKEEYKGKGIYIKCIAEENYQKAKKVKRLKVNTFIINFRTQLVNELVQYAAKVFLENHKDIYNGYFNKALLEDNSKYHIALKVLKNVAFKHVFSDDEVELLELKGNSSIRGLLDCYKPLLTLPNKKFLCLINGEKNDTPIESRLFKRLSNKHISSYEKVIDELNKKNIKGFKFKILEWYYRGRLLIDFISGMTDEYAIKEFQELSAIK